MSLKNLKTLRKCLEYLQPKMSELQFLKTSIFPRACSKQQKWVEVNIFLFKILLSLHF